METNKVIEQDNDWPLEVRKLSRSIRITQTYDDSEGYVTIQHAQATEVAKAICPKYQQVIDALNKLVQLKDIKEIPEMAEHYETMKPKAWQQARQILKELNV